MGDVDEYLSTIDGADRDALEHVYAVAREIVPEAEQGTSYAMPALLYRGKGLVSTVRGRRFLSVYPFSGAVVASLADALADFETTTGSIHYSADHQLPEPTLQRLVEARRDEIDA
ncbi:iron chaperone, partial [Nostocoides japonicum]|uniref:iron chaperone n=1 Tax=Nostocoides japonicum TaxID=99481 RepID=UPI00065C0678